MEDPLHRKDIWQHPQVGPRPTSISRDLSVVVVLAFRILPLLQQSSLNQVSGPVCSLSNCVFVRFAWNSSAKKKPVASWTLKLHLQLQTFSSVGSLLQLGVE